jgi:hypothetical protein
MYNIDKVRADGCCRANANTSKGDFWRVTVYDKRRLKPRDDGEDDVIGYSQRWAHGGMATKTVISDHRIWPGVKSTSTSINMPSTTKANKGCLKPIPASSNTIRSSTLFNVPIFNFCFSLSS